jgi:predicted dehydrogenase
MEARPTRRLRVGLIGCGGIAQMMHLPHLRELTDHYQVVGLSDLNARTLEAVADFYGVDARFADYRDLLATDVDAVLILTGGSHAQTAIAAARAGKHIFVEKPLCYTLGEADAIAAAVAAGGVQLMVGYMKRYDPAYVYAQRALRSVADLRYVRITVLHPASELYYQHHQFHPDAPPGPMSVAELAGRMVAACAGGEAGAAMAEILGPDAPSIQRVALGMMLGSLCHDVNALRGLLGEPSEVLFTDIWNEGLAFSSTLRYATGVHASLTWTYLGDLRHYDEEIACFADAARVRLNFPSPFLRNFPTEVHLEGVETWWDSPEAATWEKRVTVSYHEAFKEELVHFHRCIVQGQPPRTDLADSRADLTLIHQMARAWSGPRRPA